MENDIENVMSLITRLKIKLPQSILERVICGGFNILKEAKYIPDTNGFGIDYSMQNEMFKTLKTVMVNSEIKPAKGNTPDWILNNEMLLDIGIRIYRHFSKEKGWNTRWIKIDFIPAEMSLKEQSGFKDDTPKRFILKLNPMSDNEIKDYIFNEMYDSYIDLKISNFRNGFKREKKRLKLESEIPRIKSKYQNIFAKELLEKNIIDSNFRVLVPRRKFDKILSLLMKGIVSKTNMINHLTCSYSHCGKRFIPTSKHQINPAEKGLPVYCPPPSSCKQLAYKERKKEQFKEMQKLAELKSKRKK